MSKTSAGILLYRFNNSGLDFFLAHPGGPFFAQKDNGVWSIPKGEPLPGEDLLETAKREFFEEIGVRVEGIFIELDPIKQKGGKIIYAWALEKNLEPQIIHCNNIEIEWPPKSGKKISFPEIDKAEWFPIELALKKILPSQAVFIKKVVNKVS